VLLDGRVLIAGAGIGGLTLGCALRQAGVACEILERQPASRVVGAGILVQTSAMLALRTLGLDEAVLAAGREVRTGYGTTEKGAVLQRASMHAVSEAMGAPTVAIHRARLQAVLLGGLEGVPIHRGAEVRGYEQSDASVSVLLAGGRREDGAMLVGADGLHSAVRAKLAGDTPLRYAGYTSFRGIAELEGVVPEGEVKEMWGRAARFGFASIAPGEVYWFAVLNAPEGEQDEQPLEFVRPRFGDFAEPVPTLLRATKPERVLRTDIHDRLPLERWSDGRVTLLGDAAHPTTPNLGQGGCMAIEDAVILAHALRTADSLAGALERYEARRLARTTRIVEASYRFGRIAQLESRAAIWVRNTLMRLTPASLVEKQLRESARFSVEAP
jgi:2-polyprenyl-6-methoxyphenol hydroxylase-like FAD-dependent oxidoreductase